MSDEEKLTKGDIYDLFYEIGTCSRAGGGTNRKKMVRRQAPFEEVSAMKDTINSIKYPKARNALLKYYNKHLLRKSNIGAPTPPPTSKWFMIIKQRK